MVLSLAIALLVAPPVRAESPAPAAQYVVGGSPSGVAVNPAGTVAIVANGSSNNASRIDLLTGSVTTIGTGASPAWVAIDPSGTYAYVTNSGTNTVTRINLSDSSTTSITVGSGPGRVVIDSSGTYAYVLIGSPWAGSTADVDRIRLSDNSVTTGWLTGATGPLVVSADGTTVYSYGGTGKVFNAATGAATSTFTVGSSSLGITAAGLSSDGTALFGIDQNGDVRKTVISGYTTTTFPDRVGWGANDWVTIGEYGWVPGLLDHTLSRINLSTGVVTTIATGLNVYPKGIAAPADGAFVLVTVAGSNVVDRYSTVSAPDTPPAPTAVAGDALATVTAASAGSGSAVTSLTVTANPGGRACTITGSSGSCEVSLLTNGQAYTFTVVANGAGGASSSSSSSSPVTPRASAPQSNEGSADVLALPARFNLVFVAGPGRCNAPGSGAVASGEWVTLPTAVDCLRAGFILSGWSVGAVAPHSDLVLKPGKQAQVTGDNRLFAVWTPLVAATQSTQSGPTVAPISIAKSAAVKCVNKAGKTKRFATAKCPSGWKRR